MRNCVVEHLGRRVDLRAIGSNPRPSRHRGFFRRCINHQRGCAARIAGSHDGSARARPVACRCCALRFSDDALVPICGPAGAVRCCNAFHSVPSRPETRNGQSYVRFRAFWNFCFVSRRGANVWRSGNQIASVHTRHAQTQAASPARRAYQHLSAGRVRSIMCGKRWCRHFFVGVLDLTRERDEPSVAEDQLHRTKPGPMECCD